MEENLNKKKFNKKIYVIAILIALVFVVTVTAVSYAYFTAGVTNSTINDTVITTGSMEIEFTDGSEVSLENTLPGTHVEKTFKIKNTGSLATTYDVYLSDLINTFEDKSDLVYTLTSADGGANVSSQTQLPDVSTKIVNAQPIGVGDEHNYTLRIDFLETNDDQNDNKGKSFSTIIRVNEVKMGVKNSLIGMALLKEYTNENNLDSYTVEDKTYNVRVYNYNGDQEWTTSTVPNNGIFGDSSDIGTNSSYAQRMVIVKVNGDLTIGSGVTIQPISSSYGGPKGFALIVTGTITNNGTIDNSHGAYAEGENVYLWQNVTPATNDDKYEFVPAEGGAGGDAAYVYRYGSGYSSGNPGQASATTRGTGGGGAGVAVKNDTVDVYSGRGGKGTSYSGGAGGGASSSIYQTNGNPGSDFGGAGGAGVSSGSNANAGGGAGNPGGQGKEGNGGNNSSFSGKNGTGGLLIIYSDSFVNNSSGNITATGKLGGTGTWQMGASSGGGSINLFYNSTYTNNNTSANQGISADGGATTTCGGSCGRTGGAGGAGSVTIGSVETGNFVANS